MIAFCSDNRYGGRVMRHARESALNVVAYKGGSGWAEASLFWAPDETAGMQSATLFLFALVAVVAAG